MPSLYNTLSSSRERNHEGAGLTTGVPEKHVLPHATRSLKPPCMPELRFHGERGWSCCRRDRREGPQQTGLFTFSLCLLTPRPGVQKRKGQLQTWGGEEGSRGGEGKWGGEAEEGVELLSIHRPAETPSEQPRSSSSSIASTVCLLSGSCNHFFGGVKPPRPPNYFWRKTTLFGQVGRLALLLSSLSFQ